MCAEIARHFVIQCIVGLVRAFRLHRVVLVQTQARAGAHPAFDYRDFGAIIPRCGSMALNETGLDEAKEVRSASACRLSLSLPARARSWVHDHLPQAAFGVTYRETLAKSAGECARGDRAVAVRVREGWPAYSAPDRDLASPIDQLVPVADADA